MRIRLSFLAPILVLAVPLTAQEVNGAFCVEAPFDQLCPIFPQDVPEFSEFFEYMVISGGAQAPFDRHAWQAFVALNWSDVADDATATGWRDFPPRDLVLGYDRDIHCAAQATQAEVIITDLAQSDGHALIDRNGNYILYETRMNRVAADYIRDTRLHTLAGQTAAPVDFPRGRDAEAPASVMLKTAWTILQAPSDDFVTAQGLVIVPPAHSQTGERLCLNVTLGLVGMHIVTKVESGNGEEWIWATFEHRANAPVAADARNINAIYGTDLFPKGCVVPDALNRDLLLYDPKLDARANTPPQTAAFWSETPPHAVSPSGIPLPTSQAVRCWEIFAPTQATNAQWQIALEGTVLSRYMLISAQWRGANISPYLEHGELPRFLSNVAMETYVQTERSGTCLGCHASAATATGAPADFTFVLRDVAQ